MEHIQERVEAKKHLQCYIMQNQLLVISRSSFIYTSMVNYKFYTSIWSMPSTFLFDGQSDGFCQKSIYTTRRGKYQSKIRYDIHFLRPKTKGENPFFQNQQCMNSSSIFLRGAQGFSFCKRCLVLPPKCRNLKVNYSSLCIF